MTGRIDYEKLAELSFEAAAAQQGGTLDAATERAILTQILTEINLTGRTVEHILAVANADNSLLQTLEEKLFALGRMSPEGKFAALLMEKPENFISEDIIFEKIYGGIANPRKERIIFDAQTLQEQLSAYASIRRRKDGDKWSYAWFPK